MPHLSRNVSVPLPLILLALIGPPLIILGLFVWRAVGDVPFVNVEFFPDDDEGTTIVVSLDDTTPTAEPPSESEPPQESGSSGPALPPPTPNVTSEVVVSGAEFPVAIAFAPDGRLFYNELLTGNIRVVQPDGTLLPEPFARVDADTSGRGGEWGLLGIALDPDFETSGYVYVYYTKPIETDVAQPTVLRFTDVDNKGTDPTVIVGDLPQTLPEHPGFHVAGNIHFGPDGYLYIAIGEYNMPWFAQDLTRPEGKILRVDKSGGSAPPDNPFSNLGPLDPRVYASGLRNPFDFTFHPETGELYANVNGPNTCDALHLIKAGQFYGWPHDLEPPSCDGLPGLPPVYHYTRPGMTPEMVGATVAPTGIEFVSGEVYPSLGDSLLVCEFNTQFLRRLVLTGEALDSVYSDNVVAEGCRLDIAVSPDGIVYYTNETEIRRLVPGGDASTSQP